MSKRGIVEDPEDDFIPPHHYVVVSADQKVNLPLILLVRAINLIAEIEEAVLVNWEGFSSEDMALVPIIFADYIVESQSALNAGIALLMEAKKSEELGYILENYQQGIHWQRNVLEKDGPRKNQRLEVMEQIIFILEA